MAYVELVKLKWPEVSGLSSSAVGLIPLGSIEQHGPHMPVATDALIAEHLAKAIAEKLDEDVVVAPVLPGGVSGYHRYFPGTVDLGGDVVGGYIRAYITAFEDMAIQKVAVFSSHGGNFGIIEEIQREYRGSATMVIGYSDLPRYLAVMFAGARRAGVDPPITDTHAGGIETSQGLAAFPQLVGDYKSVSGYAAAEPGWNTKLMTDGVQTLTASGVFGDPALASEAAGVSIFEALRDELCAWMAEQFGAAPNPGVPS